MIESTQKHIAGLQALLKMAVSYPQKARVIGFAIPVTKLDCRTIVEASDSEDSEVIILAWDLAMRIPFEQLDYVVLFNLCESGGSDACELSRELLLKIPGNKMRKDLLQMYAKDGSSYYIKGLANELLLRNFGDSFDLAELIKLCSSPNENACAMARELALKFSAGEGEFNLLLNTHTLELSENHEGLIEELLLKHFPDRLSYVSLMDCQESSNDGVRARARELALRIPAGELDSDALQQYARDKDPDVSNLAQDLLLRNFPELTITEEIEGFIRNYFG